MSARVGIHAQWQKTHMHMHPAHGSDTIADHPLPRRTSGKILRIKTRHRQRTDVQAVRLRRPEEFASHRVDCQRILKRLALPQSAHIDFEPAAADGLRYPE